MALNWNLGEENTNSDAQRKAYADFFKQTDPYKHPVVMHTYPGAQEGNYSPLLGYANFDGASIQTGLDSGFSQTLEWVTRSADAGHKWIVAFDEQAPSTDVRSNNAREWLTSQSQNFLLFILTLASLFITGRQTRFC